ncbi:hypothetical protein J1N35_022822 [Gossypium stocksii]|uniref:Uncharacterized protein n=1 Tax=Gossypium stocksii TaxID=47602 RepID=A0A9D4A1I2_9ROSI|nr:hypothetical protein J1N35_022822 [Gossypium stocksii]
MEISSTLKGAHTQGKAATASSIKTTVRKIEKRIKAEESIQESESSKCPLLIRHRPSRDPIAVVTLTPLVLALLENPSLLEESALHLSFPILSSNPTLLENILWAIPIVQSRFLLLKYQMLPLLE